MDSNNGSPPPPPPQGGDPSMSGLSSPQGLDMCDLSSAPPLVSTVFGVSSARPPALFPTASVDSTAQTGHTNGADWQEEVYQKIKVMKEMYYPELSEMYQKIAAKLQQHDSLPQQPKSDQLEKLKMFKSMLERLITVLQVSKPSISPGLKDKLVLYEKQIINFINTNRPRKPVSSLQQGQLPPPHMHSMQQSQSQITQVQSHENQMNPQLQSMNLQSSVPTMQQNNMTDVQQNSMSSLSGVSTVQQNMMNPLQPSSNMDPGQGNTLNSLQQVPMGSIQQTSVSAPQQANMNALSSQMLQGNINPLQSNSGILHNQHLKQEQQQQQQMYQNQFKQQLLHRQMQPQLMQKQQIIQQQLQHRQQLHQQAKQQLPGQLQTHQMPQLHQINDVNDVKMRPGMGVKPGAFQQHLSVGQRAYAHQQLKLGSPFPITSSAQLLQVQCPQISQHSSPQVDQQNLLVPKAGTPLQTASSPFVIPSPSTPMAPSPMPGDSEKPSSLSNAANIGHQQTTGAGALVQSLAIGTPGISASPLLAEFSGPDGTHANALSTMSGKSSVTEQPLECLIKADSKASSVQPQKMLTFLNKPQKTMVNSLESNGAGNSNGLLNPGSSGVQPQVTNQGQSVSIPLPANQSQTRLQFVPWNIQNNVLPSGVQSSAGLSSALSPTMHYHLYYLQPPAAGQNMSGLSSARPPALFPAGALTAQQNMMNLSRPISSMVPGQGHAPKNLLQQVPVGSIQQTPVSAPQQANMNALSSQNGINMPQTNISQQQRLQQLVQAQQIFQQRQQQRPGQSLTHQMPQLHQISVVNDVSKNASSSPSGSTMLQASIDSLQSNSGIVDNQHLKHEQEQKVFQKQLKLPYQQLLMRQPQILQDKQQQQIQQLQQQAKQQLHHIYFIYLIFLTILLGAAFFGTGY
ncbi:hypothetical protein M0R45_017784 [Rubus argutus]|uniref:Mediator of RNA polymerase II transcription subunit 15a-like n=1 Tax=Rubus argutus TaxID=59490 RepID=A0AAW1XXB4_RUBAR